MAQYAGGRGIVPLFWRYKASVSVHAAHIIKPAVTELPTRNRGEYSVS